MENGLSATFQDNGPHGEDAFLTKELGPTGSLDVVLDGVTHCEGGYASSFTAQVLREAQIESARDVLNALEEANKILFQGGRGRNLLTTVSVALKLGQELHIISAGDSPVYLVRGGKARQLTNIERPTSLSGVTNGAIGLKEKLECFSGSITLEPRDRLILTTDGLTNNVYIEEVEEVIERSATPEDATAALQALVNEKRSQRKGREDFYGTFREDDQTVTIRYFA